MKFFRKRVALTLFVSIAILTLILSVSQEKLQQVTGMSPDGSSDGLMEEFASRKKDMTSWVSISDPEQVAAGYTLLLYKRRIPYLLDLEGHVVHSWPNVRAVGRARLSHDGHLLVITRADQIEEYDWEGRLLFRYSLPEGHSPHHDIIQLQNGNFLVMAHFKRSRSNPVVQDYLQEVDREGRTVWQWNARDHARRFETWDYKDKDPSHINSVKELVDNAAFATGDERFRPGNLLVSGRNLNTIFVIDKLNGQVVWQYSEGLDFQHEPLMIPDGYVNAGNIIVFNNGLGDRETYRRTRVQILNPQTLELVWEYSSPFFYSSVAGLAQPLWNGNVMVTSSHGGRVFELTPEGEIVWQWEPPNSQPMRPNRYPRDHNPQMADLDWSPPTVRSRALPFLDKDLYNFRLSPQPFRKIPGWEGKAMKDLRNCRQLVIPPDATFRVKYGLHRQALKGQPFEARFVVELQDKESGDTTRLLDDVIRSDQDELTRDITVSLADRAFVSTELCLDAQPLGEPKGVSPEKAIVWISPQIKTRGDTDLDSESKLIQEERDLRMRQLKTLGYIQ